MALPSKIIGGGGDNAATECIRTSFSTALSTAPKIEAWDNTETFPAVLSSGAATTKEIFTGTTGNGSLPMLAAFSGGASLASTPPSADWHPASATGGSANPNLLLGTTNYVTCTNTPGAGETTVYNVSLKVASDCTVPSTSTMAALFQIRYTYTGAAPTVTFHYNDGGTETTPIYTAFTPGTHGSRFVNAGTVSGTYKLTLPVSGTLVADEVWITA